MSRLDGEKMAQALLDMYDANRRDLPWRGESDLYRIWVAEVMLQQTGVQTVLPYYHKFLFHFPCVVTLAQASEEAVLACWQGLGYYRRAIHLHGAARRVVGEMQGRIPLTLEGLLSLPGIGVSTAGAILAIGLNQRHAILDGNVKRVLARVMGLEQGVETPSAREALWSMARHLTSWERPGDYAQAIMDLGATICRFRKPGCAICPWSGWCQAFLQGCPESYPVVSPKAVKPHKYQFNALVVRQDGHLLLMPRPRRGLLGGFWEPPGGDFSTLSTPPAPEIVNQELTTRFAISVAKPYPLEPVEHVFTHFRLTVWPFFCSWLSGTPPTARWISHNNPEATLPISTLHRKVLARGVG